MNQNAIIPEGFDFDRLVVQKRLGGSLFYEVWLVILEGENATQTFALKSIRPELATETARLRIVHEGRQLKTLSHQGVVACHASGMFKGEPALLLDYHANSPNIGKETRLSGIKAWTDQLLAVLDYLHTEAPAAPVIHGDIRSANLRLNSDGHIVLIDFGSSVSRDFLPPPSLGTHIHLARESRLAGAAPQAMDDLAAVGVLVWSWLESLVATEDDSIERVRMIDWVRDLRQERFQSAHDALMALEF